jgi:hypothetical protein
MKSIRMLLLVLLAVGLFATGAQIAMAQTLETGALTGTVTDASGGVIAGATVTITSLSTGQSRTTTTDSSGSYRFGLLNPDNYKVTFSASGFKTAEVPSVTVHVTETPVLNHNLEVGTQTQQVTVEASVETIQTQNATNGGVVTAQEVTSLPLVSRNYTQIINLSPGVVANATTSSSIGNGTEDVSANGSRGDQNNYLMDGSSVVNYVSGTASQSGSFPGIAIPNPDAIQEFKVQTSQYDASAGRNPGANVEVITKSGTNQIHGALWEFNRNNFLNANDFFFKRFQASQGEANSPQTLKQNTFGGTIGGPIKKNKIFFFGSYQGIRQVNGVGTSGFAFGFTPNTNLLPWNDYADVANHVCTDVRCTGNVAAYRAYLGRVFGGEQAAAAGLGGDGQTVAADGSNISNTAIALLQAKGIDKGPYNQGFYFPSMTANQVQNYLNCSNNIGVESLALNDGCLSAISEPIHANENQYLVNTDYVLSSKHTLSEKYMYATDPQTQTFNCFINATVCNPGSPINAHYINHVGQLKLTSVLTNNLVNEARFSFHRDIENNTDPTPVLACGLSSTANIIPMVNNGEPCPLTTTGTFAALAKKFPELNVVPILDVTGGVGGPWSQGGNFAMISSNFINTFQEGDQISWTHGMHTIRAGFEAERVQYNNTIPASGRGELLISTTADFLTSSSGPPGGDPNDPTYDDGTPAATQGSLGFFGFGLKGPLTHYNRINAFNWYVQDDIKVNRKLTVNAGLRWEYDGFPDDVSGQFSNIWTTQLAKVNTGSFFLNDAATTFCPTSGGPVGTLAGFIVPSNYDKTPGLTSPCGATGVVVNSNKTLLPGTPWHDFAPRLGVAWQPLGDRFVVRAGYGWFYDRVYGNLLIDNQLNLPPYSGAGFGSYPANQVNTLHDPWAAGAGPLVWTPRTAECLGPCTTGFLGSGLNYTSDSPQLANRLPLVQLYNLDFQYEFAKGWIADVGYVGSHSIHLYNYGQDINLAHLVANAPNEPTGASGVQNMAMVASSIPFNDPANTNPITANSVACFPCGLFFSNADGRANYLGITAGGLATTNTNGDALYNSLQAQLRHQFSHGLLLQVAYTWSKEFTNINSSESGGFLQPNGGVLNGGSNSNYSSDLSQQYGLAAFERPQRVVISYVYDIPGSHREGFVGKAFSGWSISGVTTIQSGQPFTIIDAGGSIYGAASSRAALLDPVKCNALGNCESGIPLKTAGSDTQRINEWFNTAAFIPLCTSGSSCTNPLPASSPYCIGGIPNPGESSGSATCGSIGAPFWGAGTGWGNSSVGSVFGPDQVNWDAAIVKDTKVWEGGTVEFRSEFFNLWNHTQFNPPGNNVNIPLFFGRITSTANTPRVIQFGLKLLF